MKAKKILKTPAAELKVLISQIKSIPFNELKGQSDKPFIQDEEFITNIKELVKRGAHINTRDDQKWTALHRAVYAKRYQLAEWLLKNDAEIDAKLPGGLTLLQDSMLSFYKEEMLKCEWLVIHGADIDAKMEGGYTLLMLMASKEWTRALAESPDITGRLRWLISNSASLLEQNDEGFTALHIAALCGQVFAIEVLLSAMTAQGINPAIPNKQGQTPCALAVEQHHFVIAALLAAAEKGFC
jgi:ankyrin repeat protein